MSRAELSFSYGAPVCAEPSSWWDAEAAGSASPAEVDVPVSGQLPVGDLALVAPGGAGWSRLAATAAGDALAAARTAQAISAGSAEVAVGIGAAEAFVLTAAKWLGPIGLMFMPPPEVGVPPKKDAPRQAPMEVGGAALRVGLPGPNGEEEEDPRFVTPDAGVTRGVLRPLYNETASGDDSRPSASASQPPSSAAGGGGSGHDAGVPTPVDLDKHIGREGHAVGLLQPGLGAPKLVVAHGGYTVGGPLPDRVFEVDQARVTLLREGITMPTLITNALLSGDWTGKAYLEQLESQGTLNARGQAYLAKARENGGIHPYLEGAASYLDGARVLDYRLRAPTGLRLHANQYSVADARFATVSEVAPPMSEVEASSCTRVKVAGSDECLLTLHGYAPLAGKVDLPGGYWVDPATGHRTVDPAWVARAVWRHDFDLVGPLDRSMTADVVAEKVGLDRAAMEAALMTLNPLFDGSRFEHPLSADPAVVDVVKAGLPPLPDGQYEGHGEISRIDRDVRRVQAALQRTQTYIGALEDDGFARPAQAARELADELGHYVKAANEQKWELESRRLDALLEQEWDIH